MNFGGIPKNEFNSDGPSTSSASSNSSLEDLPWWKTSVVYQVYPRSFLDTTGDGVGDLRGISQKADYLKDLGIGAVWVSPFYTSPMADFGYDVSNFTDVDPIFGTMEDFKFMLKELQSRGLKVILDFVPNHTSNLHKWFELSEQRQDPYTDFYIWANAIGVNDTGDPIPPNNWLSVFGDSAWTWSDTRKQFYYHQFLPEQPDVNARNPLVMEQLTAALKFWLDLGVDGFRLDALKHLFEVEDIHQNEPVALNSGVKEEREWEYLEHTLTTNLEETVDAVREWRKLFDQYDDRMMVVEVYDNDINEILKYYEPGLASFPFNFYFISEHSDRSSISGPKLLNTVNLWMDNITPGWWPNWVLGNHDRSRVGTRFGPDLVDAMNMVSLLLPGTPTTYYGEEIGMADTFVSFEETQDPFGINFGPERYQEKSRDPQRTPMQWDASPNAGFTTSSNTWLPVNDNYQIVNVANQLQQPQSHIKVYKSLTKLRKEKSFVNGTLEFPFISEDIFSFYRHAEGHSKYLVIVNTSPDTASLSSQPFAQDLATQSLSGNTVIRSMSDGRIETDPGSIVNLSTLHLFGGEGMVIKIIEK